MIFNSIEFAIFLPIVFLFYWFVFNRSLRLQNLFIVVVSYIFYGWWNWKFLFLIAFTSFCSWSSGLFIDRFRQTRLVSKSVAIVNVVLNLAILGVFKYYNFFATSFANFFLGGNTDGILLNLILPVGISFYTFQALSYTIDVFKNKIRPTEDIIEFFAYVCFFPQLVAGPIERATNLLPQFQTKRNFCYDDAVDGCRQMLWGLFKKVVVADNCAIYVNQVFSSYQQQNGSALLAAAILFAFQIYGDFSGYSDMAIGTSKLFGIKLMRNFNIPYFSRDIAEFWRRWHISLTTWFRDYIYIPLGGSRCPKWCVIRNIFIIFLVSGFWHGANWTFIAWGAYHAILFLPLILLEKNRKYRDVVAANRLLPNIKEIFQMILTFMLVVVGWIIFRAETIHQAIGFMHGMMRLETLKAITLLFSNKNILPTTIFICIMIVVEWFSRKSEHGLNMSVNTPWYIRYPVYCSIIALVVLFCGKNQTFIYFQF